MYDPMSSIVHFWAKSFKTFHEILCSRIFPCLILPYNRSRSIQGHHLNYLVSTVVHAKLHGHWSTGSGEEVLKVFTIYGHGGHIGHVTWTV